MSTALTLVVFSGSGAAADVPDVLRAWSAEGLLHDILLVAVDEGPEATPPVRGIILAAGTGTDVDIVEAIATRDLSLIRLLRLRVVKDVALPDGATDVLASRLEARLAGGHQSLLRINLIVPVHDNVPVPVEAFRGLWQRNIVVSPEDRLTERHGAASVETRLAAHAALAVTTAGALWSQMLVGPFDRSLPEQGSTPQSALIARSWARVLVGGGALRQVVTQVFGIRQSQPETLARAAGGVITRDAQIVVERSTSAYIKNVESGALSYKAGPDMPAPASVTIGLLQALRMMFAFLWVGMQRLPGLARDSAARAVQGRLERAVQSLTFGGDSAVVTSFSGRSGQALPSGSTADPAGAVRQYAQGLLTALELPEIPAATPTAWRELRGMVFGLHDGGSLPAYVEAPVSGAYREIVTDLDRLAAMPSDDPVRLADHVTSEDANQAPMQAALRECDPYQADATRIWLQQRMQEAAPARAAVQTAEEVAPEQEAVAAESTEPPEVDADAGDARRQGLERALRVLEDWVTRRSATPCWRVAEHLMKEIQRAAASLEHSLGVLKTYEEKDDADLQNRALSTLKRWWYSILAFAALMSLWWWLSKRLSKSDVAVLRALGRQGLSLGWRILVAAILIALVAFFVSFVRYQKEMFRLAHRHNRRVHEFRVAIRDAENDGREVVRLAALYEQARDWGEVIAWMLRRPQGPGRTDLAPEKTPASLATPLAFTRAAGQATPQSLQRVASQVANDRFQRGWLGELYQNYVEFAMGALAHARGLDATAVRYDPDTDLVDPKREPLAAAIRLGGPAGLWTSEITRDARTHLARTDPEDLFPEVVQLDDSQPGKVVPAREFLNDVVPSDGAVRGALPLLATFWNRSAVFSDRHRTSAVHVWLPESVQGLAAGGGLTRHTLAISPRDDDGFMLQAIRVDVAGPVSWDDVATKADPIPAPDEDDADWDVPASGLAL